MSTVGHRDLNTEGFCPPFGAILLAEWHGRLCIKGQRKPLEVQADSGHSICE